MSTDEKVKMIAGVCHEAVRAYHYSIEDGTVRTWQDVDDEHRESDMALVRRHLDPSDVKEDSVEDALVYAIAMVMAGVMLSESDRSEIVNAGTQPSPKSVGA